MAHFRCPKCGEWLHTRGIPELVNYASGGEQVLIAVAVILFGIAVGVGIGFAIWGL